LLKNINEAKTLDYENTHREIVEACKGGDRQAQFELYRLYSRAMYNICMRMTRNELDAEDLLQHSFMDIFSKLHTFRYQSSIGAWIKRIVVNNCINFLKKRKLKFEELGENHTEEVQEEKGFGAWDISNPNNSNNHLSVDKINEAIFQLPDGYRTVFSLYLLEGYDHKEIAGILDITEATSKSQYSRAKKKLKEILGPYPEK
jgi:RNA polymerase sigma-70 factor (ECF subfamily)